MLDGLAASQRGGGQFLIVHYKQLRADPASELARVLEFLGAPRDPADLAGVVEANSKDRMRAKEAKSDFLATQRTDGSTFVRTDRASDWVGDVPLGENGRRVLGYGAPSKAAGAAVQQRSRPGAPSPSLPTCPLSSTGVESPERAYRFVHRRSCCRLGMTTSWS